MNSHKEKPPTDFEVDDPAAAFRKLEDAARRIMAVPKKAADANSGKVKTARRQKRR